MRENRIRFLIDEDTSHVIRDGLRHHQQEIEVRVVGGENAPPKGTGDDAILQFLEREGFILVTLKPIHHADTSKSPPAKGRACSRYTASPSQL